MQVPENITTMKSLETLFCQSLTQPFSDACELNWQIKVSDEPASKTPNSTEAIVYRFRFNHPLDGEAFVLVRHESISEMRLRGVETDSVSFSEEHATALLALFRSAGVELAQHLNQYGPVEVQVDHVTPELQDENVSQLVVESLDSETRFSIMIFFDTQLLNAFQSLSAKSLLYAEVIASAPSNLDLVLDVELNVTLRFGQRQLSLREILDLTSGSVVELDRQVDEPVELVLDGKVVARGEAVIIDGNYGMRITQVLQALTV